MQFGIAFINFTSAGYAITAWVQDDKGDDRIWNDYSLALEANDIQYGWIGYVRSYPDGGKPSSDCKW
jgi:hypothetical protein